MSFYEVSDLNHESKNIQNFIFYKPKKVNNKQISKVFYEDENDKKQFIINTRKLQVYKHTLTKNNDENLINFYLILNEDNSELSSLFSELDELNTTKVIENSKNWFGQKLNLEQADDSYKPFIKYNIKERQAYIIVSIPITDNNSLLVEVVNQYRRKLNFNELIDAQYLDIKLLFNGIKFSKQTFTPLFEPIYVKAFLKRQNMSIEYQFTNDGIDFIDDLNEEDSDISDDDKYLDNDSNSEECLNIQDNENINLNNQDNENNQDNQNNEDNLDNLDNLDSLDNENNENNQDSLDNENNQDSLDNEKDKKELNNNLDEKEFKLEEQNEEESEIKNIKINRNLEKNIKKKKVINNGRKKKFLNKL
jgi:hypothetical protein